MDESRKTYWAFRVQVVDRAGALTSVASAFSNSSINVDTVVGYGADEAAGWQPEVLVGFWGTEEDKDLMSRRIQRLTKVVRVACTQGNPAGQRDSVRHIVEQFRRDMRERNDWSVQ